MLYCLYAARYGRVRAPGRRARGKQGAKSARGSTPMGLISLVFVILITLVRVFPWVLMAGWIVGMADPGGRWAITRILNTIGMPFLRLVSGMLPRIGALDISPFIIIILSWLVGALLGRSFFG